MATKHRNAEHYAETLKAFYAHTLRDALSVSVASERDAEHARFETRSDALRDALSVSERAWYALVYARTLKASQTLRERIAPAKDTLSKHRIFVRGSACVLTDANHYRHHSYNPARHANLVPFGVSSVCFWRHTDDTHRYHANLYDTHAYLVLKAQVTNRRRKAEHKKRKSLSHIMRDIARSYAYIADKQGNGDAPRETLRRSETTRTRTIAQKHKKHTDTETLREHRDAHRDALRRRDAERDAPILKARTDALRASERRTETLCADMVQCDTHTLVSAKTATVSEYHTTQRA